MRVTRLLPLLALTAAAAPAMGVQAGDTVRIVVAATTDIHGRVFHWDYVRDREAGWGLTRAATVLDSLRSAHPGRVVLVDAGDVIQGNPFATYFARVERRDPHPVIDAMNYLRYDAAAPGNHEFNFGVATFDRAVQAARFPFVAANVYRLPGGERPFPSYVTIERAGVRIGIAGFTTPGSMGWDQANLAGRLRVAPVLPDAERTLAAMRDANLDLRIVTIHSGMDAPSSYDATGIGPENVAAELARLPSAPHLVNVGHSHRTMRDSVLQGVHFIQAENWVQSVAVAEVWLARGSGGADGAGDRGARYRVVRVEGTQIPLDDVPPSPQMVHHVRQQHEAVLAWVRAPLARTEGNWDARYARVEDTPVIDWINAVQREVAGADLSATAAFNTGATLGASVRLGDLVGIYPHENTLKAVRIDGARLKAFLERSAEYFRAGPDGPVINDSMPGYNFDIVSGVEYAIDLSRPVGSRIRQLARQGRLVSETDTFTLALNNYRQAGGGGFSMLAGLPVVYDGGENIRDLLVEHARAAGVLRADDWFEPSWRIIPDEAREAVRAHFAPPVGPATDTVVLRVLTINDLHGQLEAHTPGFADGRRVGGIAEVAAWMDTLAVRCACPTIEVDAGDQMQGTPISSWVHGRSTVEALNALGLDAAAIGNHEFDWGIDTLRARLDQARYPWLAANVRLAGGGTPPWAEPWAMLEAGGLRIGVIGVTLETTSTSANPDLVASLAFDDPALAVRRTLPALRAASPDVVVVLAHEGAFCDSVTCRGSVIGLARDLDSAMVDMIVSGHTHSRIATTVNGIPIVQAYARGTAVGVIDLVRRADGSRLVRTDVVTTWADSVTPDTAVARIVGRYARETDQLASRPVARLRFALPRGGGEHALGRLIADAYRNVARTDVALINNTGIRDGLPGGLVNYGDVFRAQPFGNMIVRLEVSGALLRRVLEHALREDEPFAHIGGATVRWDPRRPVGERVREIRLSGDRRVRDDETYTLAVPDFIAAGGSGYAMLRGIPSVSTGTVDVEAVTLYLQRLPEPVEVGGGARFRAER